MSNYIKSPTNGESWLVEAGDLDPGQELWFNRVKDPSLVTKEGGWYSGYRLQVADAGPALLAAYPEKTFLVDQHGSQFTCERIT